MLDSTSASRPVRGWRRRAIAAATLGALLVAAIGCGGDDGTGAEPDEPQGADVEELLGPEQPASGEPVKVGMVSDGATQAFDNSDELRAAEATAEYWNEHHGGVGGRPIEVVTCETGG